MTLFSFDVQYFLNNKRRHFFQFYYVTENVVFGKTRYEKVLIENVLVLSLHYWFRVIAKSKVYQMSRVHCKEDANPHADRLAEPPAHTDPESGQQNRNPVRSVVLASCPAGRFKRLDGDNYLIN